MAGNSNGDLAMCKKITISIISIFSSVVFLGCCFERTKPMASAICAIQYPVGDESAATLYGFGPADSITLLLYVGVALIIRSCIEDVLQSLKLSPDKDFSQQMTQTLFYVYSLVFGLCVLVQGNYELSTFWNGFPDPNVPFLLKVFYLAQLAFLIQCFPQAMLNGLSPRESLKSLIEAEILVVFLVVNYVLGYSPMATAVLMTHYAHKLLFQLADSVYDSRSLKSYVRVGLFGAEQIIVLGAALCIFQYGDLRGLTLRFSAVMAAVTWTVLEGLAIYKDTRSASTGTGKDRPVFRYAIGIEKPSTVSRGRKGNGDRRRSQRGRRS